MRKRALFKATSNIDNTASVDHIGEREELTSAGTCDHPLMVPNANRTYCTLAGRVDVGRHHILTGGPASSKSYVEDIKNAIGTVFFQQYFSHDKTGPSSLSNAGIINTLFHSEKFRAASEKFCPPPSTTHREMVAITTHLPGQETPLHYDSPYFEDISRKTAPVWLLVALKQSGIWDHKEVKQIQGVAYMNCS